MDTTSSTGLASEQTTTVPLFEFEMRYVSRPTGPYYYTNWDRSSTATVLAETREQAYTNLWAMLGDAGTHRTWTAKVLTAKQVVR